MPRIAWSFTKLDKFETCPWQFYLTEVTKEVKVGTTPEMAWGRKVHDALDHRLSKRTPLPSNMAHWEPISARLERTAQMPGSVLLTEQKFTLNEHYQQTSWFAKDAWVRAITDVTIIRGRKAAVFDYKTGKPKPGSDQLNLTAAMTFIAYPQVEEIANSFIWLKTNTADREVIKREDMHKVWQMFAPRIQRLELAHQNNTFPKKPSGLCNRYCSVPHNRCEFRGGR